METWSKGKAKPRNAQSKTAAWLKEGKNSGDVLALEAAFGGD
jgi:hypothetical protein